MNPSLKVKSVFVCLILYSSLTQATLFSRNLAGGTANAVYDDVLNITWLADANLAA